jgi:hypothetical protein|nr:MAG TPA: hypothetical protein [Caudoviricetes sp.]
MSKQLQTIIEKAHKTGFANKNGRYYIYYQGYSELESQWQARYNKETDTFELDHWGTNIVILEQFSTFPLVAHIYGQSKSDRDALVQLFNYCGRNDFHVSYRPSKDEFYVKAQFVGKKTLEDYII